MHHSRHARDRSSQLEFEDVITVELPDDGHVDRQYLRAVFRSPHHYLPARRRPSRRHEPPVTAGNTRLARRAKQTGLLVSLCALVSAIVTAAVLAEQPTQHGSATTRSGRANDDIRALGAFTSSVGGTDTNSTTAPGQPSSPATTQPGTTQPEHAGTAAAPQHGSHPVTDQETHHNVTPPAESTEPTDGSTTATRVPATKTNDSPSAGHDDNGNVTIVREFYQQVDDSPEQATGLVVTDLLGQGLETLRTTWRSLHDIRLLDVRERQDGKVVARLTTHRPDGTRLYLTQLFTFAEGGLIGHVQLLSAQYS